ncbi:putative transposase [Candidatus Midichloria mitochondrii IricVA]|uniref:Putative transposase n=2 Tax=Candidatus Midichloria mitochondrii TaxID=234827 RepID=F7XUC9_MIDMI|nr:putative transposase [Candidatus Midichloria mitochondrii IricVA]
MYQRSLRNSQRQRKRESRMMLSESYNDPRFVSFEGITGSKIFT